jgi:hypothetical protein
MWTMLSCEVLRFAAWGQPSRYPLGTTVAVMAGGSLVMSLIRRLIIGDWFGSWRRFVIRIILAFCILLVFLMNPPRVVGIAVLVVITVLGIYVRFRYRKDP